MSSIVASWCSNKPGVKLLTSCPPPFSVIHGRVSLFLLTRSSTPKSFCARALLGYQWHRKDHGHACWHKSAQWQSSSTGRSERSKLTAMRATVNRNPGLTCQLLIKNHRHFHRESCRGHRAIVLWSRHEQLLSTRSTLRTQLTLLCQQQ